MRDGRIIQIGSPQDIVLHPEDEYVAEFVRGVSKTTVMGAGMGAGAIMEEPSREDRAQFSSYPCCLPATPVDNLVVLAAKTESPIGVVADSGELLGVVTRSVLLGALAGNLETQAQEDTADSP